MTLRKCNNPKPQYGGDKCPGKAYENGICNVEPCPCNISTPYCLFKETIILLHINHKQNTHIEIVLQPEECGQTGVSGHCALCRATMVKRREIGIVKAGLNVMELTIPNLLSKKQHVTMVHAQVIISLNNNSVTTKYYLL